jgi:hypothetical protein
LIDDIATAMAIPMASTKLSNDKVLMVNPNNGKMANAPIKNTGTAIVGISVALALCRKIYTTSITRANACSATSRPLASGS